MRKELITILLAATYLHSEAQVNYPVTQKIDHIDTYFGHQVEDPYQWLEDDNAEQTKEWVIKQNEVTQKYLSQIPYRNYLKERLTVANNYVKYTDYFKAGDKIIFKKNDGLQNQAVWMYKVGVNGDEQIILDPNQMDKNGTTTYNFIGYNKEKNWIGVGVNKAGSDWMTIQIMDLNTNTFLDDVLQWVKFSSVEWYKDGFYYSKYPTPEKGKELSAASEYQSIYYHRMGTPQSEDILIYQDLNNPRHYHNVTNTEDDNYQILYKSSGTDGFETLYRKLDDAIDQPSAFQYLFKGFNHKSSVIGSQGDDFYVLTDVDAPNNQLVKINLQRPEKEHWKVVIPNSSYLLEGVTMVAGQLIATYLKNAQTELVQLDIDGNNPKVIQLPGLGTAELTYARVKDEELFYSFTSYATPLTTYSYNVQTNQSQQLNHPKLGFAMDDYVSSQVWYTSKDGTEVPMFLIHKKGVKLNGKNPTYLYGYGGFNINLTPSFSSQFLPLLEQGVVISIVNLRGGGEFGEEWHKAGMLMNKQNVFDDFIAAAEFLIKKKYTSSGKLAIAGGSNGGLLVGACMTQRPDLFKVAFPAVGVMDMLKFQDFTVGWGWVPEYGSSQQSEEMFQYLYGYSPYHNIKKGVNYPATMVTTADHDDRVVPAHSFKFAARLQEYTKNVHPALIRIDVKAGHGAGKPIGKIIDESADKWSFFLWNVGVKKLKKVKLNQMNL